MRILDVARVSAAFASRATALAAFFSESFWARFWASMLRVERLADRASVGGGEC